MVDYPNIFANGMAAYDAQTKRLQDATDYQAQRQAGTSIASGDYAGAASALGGAGDLRNQQAVTAAGQAQEDRKTALANNSLDRENSAKALAAANLLKATDAILAVPEGQRLPWVQQNAAALQSLGMPMDKFQGKTEADLSTAAIQPFRAALGKIQEDYTVGGVRYSGTTNKPVAGFAEFDPKKTVYAVGDEPPPAAGAAPPVAAAPATAPMAATAPAPDPGVRGVRNNNPLNLTTLPQGQWAGQTGADGRFAQFSTPEAGIAAADKNLQSYATNHGISTLQGIIDRWAPSGDGANNPKVYAATVAKDIGVDPNQKLDLANPQVRATILHSMSKVELGGSGAQLASAPQAVAPLAGSPEADALPPPAHIPGMHVVSQSSPEWKDMADGRQRNVLTGKIEGTATATDDVPLTPDAVKLLAGKYLNNGTLPSMGMGKTGTRNRDLILNEATAQAKALGLDANDLVAGTVTGKAAAQALNKATAMRSQVEASEQTVLKNGQAALALAPQGAGPTGAPVLNRWIQAGRKQIAGDPQVAAFDLAVGTVADEYAKVMTTSTGTGSTTSDSARQEAYRRINSAMNPQQLKAVIDQMKVEMDNRSSSLRDMEAGLRNTVRNGGQLGGMGSAPPLAPPAASPPPPPAGTGWGAAKVIRR